MIINLFFREPNCHSRPSTYGCVRGCACVYALYIDGFIDYFSIIFPITRGWVGVDRNQNPKNIEIYERDRENIATALPVKGYRELLSSDDSKRSI